MNKSNSILLADPNFNMEQSNLCTLLIKFGIDSFSYAIVNNEQHKAFVLYDEQECTQVITRFKERLAIYTYFKLVFSATKIAAHSTNDISVPDTLFDDQTVALHQQYFNDKDNSEIYLFHQQAFNYTNIFTIQKDLDQLLEENFKPINRLPYFASLIANCSNVNENQIILDFSVNSFVIAILIDAQLKFQNVYEIANLDEFQYYLLFALQQLNIDFKTIKLKVSGIIHPDDAKFTCLQKYFSEITFNNLNTDFDVQLLQQMPMHYYTNLLAQSICV